MGVLTAKIPQTVQSDSIEAFAQEIARQPKGKSAYASHFRRLALIRSFSTREELVAWLAGLSDEEIASLAEELKEVEGKARPHFGPALKLARSLAQREMKQASMPPGFSEALRWALSRAGMSIRGLAKEAGISQKTIEGWLRGAQPSSKERIRRIEDALDLPPGTLVSRMRWWGVNDTGVPVRRLSAHFRNVVTSFFRLAAQVRYGKPVGDLLPEERKALEREVLSFLARTSQRGMRIKIVSRNRFSLSFDEWPERAKVEWEEYQKWAASQRGQAEAVEASLRKGSAPKRSVRHSTLNQRRQRIERFFGYLVKVKKIPPKNLSLDLLGDYNLVHGYLKWRWERFKGINVGGKTLAQVTRTDEHLLSDILYFIRNGFVKGEPEKFRELRKAVAASLAEEPGYHNVEPLLGEEDPLAWVFEAIALMLEDLAGRVGDLLNPSFREMSAHEIQEAAALYRDALIWWAMSIYPLRAKHWYGARVHWESLERQDGEGNLYRDGEGRYYLRYRPGEFKNEHSEVFRHARNNPDAPILFPLEDPEIPGLEMEIGKWILKERTTIRLNSLMDTYLRVVHPLLLAQGKDRKRRRKKDREEDREKLFPGVNTPHRLYKMFISRSAYVLALPGVPKGLRPFGPHSMRHIVATSAVKLTNSLEHAANILLDSLPMVQRHYARFLPEDRFRASVIATWRARKGSKGGRG